MRILNITKRKDTQNNSYCLWTHTPYSHHWVLLRKLIVFLSDLFNSLSIIEAEWWIYVSVRKNIGWDNGLSPDRWQAIIWTNAGILLLVIGSVGTNFSEILIEIHIFSFKKMHLKMSPGKCQPFCLGLNVFIMYKKKSYQMFPQARGVAHYSSNWWTALYKSSSRSPPNALLNKTCMSDVARHVGPSIRIACRVIATKERKSINWNLSQY